MTRVRKADDAIMAEKIPFFRLFERISRRGTPYLSGRLGDLKLLAFREVDLTEDQLYGARARRTVYATPVDQTQQRAVTVAQAAALPAAAEERGDTTT
jgi:hypothetical protein